MVSLATADRAGRVASPARIVMALAGLYTAQSVLGGVSYNGLGAVMRKSGVSLGDIGLLLLTVIPWSFKFLWAPALERFRLPPEGGHRTRTVVVAGGLAVAGALVAAGFVQPAALATLMVLLTLAAFATATVDIACDGYAVESLPPGARGWGTSAQVAGAYLGSAIGGGAFLVIVDHAGWTVACVAMAGVILALGVAFLVSPDGPRPARAAHAERPNLAAALRRPQVRWGLLLVALYVAGQKWAMVLTAPYLVDAGLSLTVIGLINGVGGMSAGVAGALVGGALVRRIGGDRVALASMALQLLIIFGFAASAIWKITTPEMLATLAIANSGVMAAGFVALYARLMGYAAPAQAGVDFTLFQCMDGVLSLLGWQFVMNFGERLGYAWCFGAAAIVTMATLIALPAVLRRADAG